MADGWFLKSASVLGRAAIGGVIAYAGFTKLMEPMENFAAILRNYDVIPEALVMPTARILPWMEWICGSLLVMGYLARFMAWTLSLVSLGFVLVLGSGVLAKLFTGAGLDPAADCGCFGELGGTVRIWQILLFDIFSVALLVRISFLRILPLTLDGLLLGASQPKERTAKTPRNERA